MTSRPSAVLRLFLGLNSLLIAAPAAVPAPLNWRAVGPLNVVTHDSYYVGPNGSALAGRCTDAAYGKKGAMYVSAESGGIWFSPDAGKSWTHLSGQWDHQETECLHVEPRSDTIFAGLGNIYFTLRLGGVRISRDNGKTWSLKGREQFGKDTVSEIVTSPSNPGVAVLTTQSVTSYNTGGIYRSDDSGETWKRVVPPTAGYSFYDVEAALPVAGKPDTFYAGASTFQRSVNLPAIAKSVDGGKTWTFRPLPKQFITSATGREVEVATSKIDPKTVYVSTVGSPKVLKSTDAGETWTDVSPKGYAASFDLFCGKLDGEDALLTEWFDVQFSRDGAKTWQRIGNTNSAQAQFHCDVHGFAQNPDYEREFLLVTDGGVTLANLGPDHAFTFTSLGSGLNNYLVYQIEASASEERVMILGTQDNAAVSPNPDFSSWRSHLSGDGNSVALLENPNVYYALLAPGDLYWFPPGSARVENSAAPVSASEKDVWGIICAQRSQRRILLASKGVYAFDTASKKWTALLKPSQHPSSVRSLAASSAIPGVIAIGDQMARVTVSTDNGQNWATIELPPDSGLVRSLVVTGDSLKSLTLYAATGPDPAYGGVPAGGRIYRIVPGSTGWKATEIHQVQMPERIRELTIGKVKMLAVCDYSGLWIRTGDGPWRELAFANGVPRCRLTDIAVGPNSVYLTTYGLGMFEAPRGEFTAAYGASGTNR